MRDTQQTVYQGDFQFSEAEVVEILVAHLKSRGALHPNLQTGYRGTMKEEEAISGNNEKHTFLLSLRREAPLEKEPKP